MKRRGQALRSIATIPGLPDLPYDYGALQPVVSGQCIVYKQKHTVGLWKINHLFTLSSDPLIQKDSALL